MLLDGGSITVNARHITVRISSTDPAILNWLLHLGGKVYWTKPRAPTQISRGSWSLRKPVDAFYCLSAVYHLLVGRKGELATEALEVLKRDHGLREPDVSAEASRQYAEADSAAGNSDVLLKGFDKIMYLG